MNVFSLQLGCDWNPWLVILGALIISAVCAWTYWVARRGGVKVQALVPLLGYRLGAVAVVLLLLLQPIFVSKKTRTQKSVVAVMMDTSESMSVQDGPGGKTRLTQVVERLGTQKEGLLAELAKKNEVRLYKFGKTLAALKDPITDVQTVKWDKDTRLGDAMQDALGGLRGQPVAGVLLFSDGRDLGDKDGVTIAAGYHWPVFSVGIGSKTTTAKPDIFIQRVTVNEHAIVNNIVPVEVVLGAKGIENALEKVELKLGKDVKKAEVVELKGGKTEAHVHFDLRPTEVGTFFYSIEAAAVPNEVVLENNSKNFKLIVTDKKIQVLLVDGKLRAEYKFLRRALEDDQNINVFAMLKTAEDKLYLQGTPPPNTALHGVPATAAEMKAFDVVIFGDIARKNFTEAQLQAVAEYVDNGGSFAMLGGYESFGAGGYAGTAIEKVLPVSLTPSGQIEIPFALDVTTEGQASPMMQLDPNPLRSLDLWRKLGWLNGLTLVGAPKPGATVLAVDPRRQGGSGFVPVVVSQRYGKGKSLAVMADTTWRWAINPAAQQVRMHQKFWGQAIRSLLPTVQDEESKKRLLLTTNKDEFTENEAVEIRALVTDEKTTPLNDAVINCVVNTPDGKSFEVPMKRAQGVDGRYEGTFLTRTKGIHNLVATATRGGREHGADKRSFEVSGESVEMLDTSRNDPLLQNLAAATGGKFYEIGDVHQVLNELKDTSRKVIQPTDFRLWDNPFPLLLFLGLLGAEWIYRKKRNLR